MKKQRGFTLVELLAAMAIIAVLIGLAVFGVSLAQRASRNTQRRSAASDMSLAVQSVYENTGAYPASIACAVPPGNTMTVGTESVPLTGAQTCLTTVSATTTDTATAPACTVAPGGTCFHYMITTTGYKICVKLENSTIWFNGGIDKSSSSASYAWCR